MSLILMGTMAGQSTASTFNPVSDWSLPPLHAFSTADTYWTPPADGGSVSSWRNAGSAVKGAYIGAKGLVLPGITGNYASTPDAAALDITGDITIVAKVTASDWTPAASFIPIGKNNTTTQRSYHLAVITTGELRLTWSTTGSDAPSKTSTVATGFADGSTHWIAGTLDVNDGSGNHVVKFWTSDDGTTWTQLGTTVTTAGTTSIWAGTEPLTIGGVVSGTSSLLTGTVHRAQIYSGVRDFSGTPSGGTLAFDADFEAATEDSTSFTESSSNAATVTINSVPRAAHINANGLALPGVTGNYATAPDSAALSITGDIEIAANVTLSDWTPANIHYICGKGDGIAYDYVLFVKATTGLLQFRWYDGAARTADSTVAPTVSDGASLWVKATLDVNNGAGGCDVKFYTSSDGSSWTQLGSTVTQAFTTSISDRATSIGFGCIGAGQGGSSFVGTVKRVIVKNGIGGTTVLDADFESATPNVSQFTESSSNALTVTINSSIDQKQTTGSKQPTYDASNPAFNGAATVTFDGTDDVLVMDPTDIPQPYWFVAVASLAASGDQRIAGIGTSTAYGFGRRGAGGDLMMSFGASVSGGTPNTNAHLWVARAEGASSTLSVDGTGVLASNAGAVALSVMSLGAGNAGVGTYAFYQGGHTSLLLVFNTDPTALPEWASFTAWVTSTYGIVVA